MREIKEKLIRRIIINQELYYQQIPIGVPKGEDYSSKSPTPDSVNLVHNDNQED